MFVETLNVSTQVGGIMNKLGIKAVAVSTAISVGALFAGSTQADQKIDQILAAGQNKTAQAQKSQQNVDSIVEETTNLLQKFKAVNKDIEGLRVYNAQYERQLDSQRKVIDELEESIGQVTILERQIQPLILKMLDGLEQSVELDMPFRIEERRERIQQLRDNQDSAKMTVSEKFRQVLEAYSIEAEYGRKVETYTDTLTIDGQERQVNILAVGRVALLYQTKDTNLTGAWDSKAGDWVALDAGEYRSAIMQGIKIAKKQASIDVMQLPILAPEAAR